MTVTKTRGREVNQFITIIPIDYFTHIYEMRIHQKQYFRKKDQMVMRKAMDKEAIIDNFNFYFVQKLVNNEDEFVGQQNLIKDIIKMRQLQKNYFNSRSSGILELAKRMETIVDAGLKTLIAQDLINIDCTYVSTSPVNRR